MKKEDKKKICNKICAKIFMALLIAFFALYVSEATGYYEFEQHKKTTLTEEKIKQFEQDVAEGKNIDISDYVNDEDYDYQTKVSKAGLYISENIGDVVKSGIEGTFKFLNNALG